MTSQIPDILIWKRKKFELLGYQREDEGYELFNPEKLGMSPQMMHTACYRGFYCGFRIVKNFLYLDTLCVYDGNGYYPAINGVEVTPGGRNASEYANINLLIPYTGLMRIGADFHEEHYIHMGFQKPSAYGIVWDLEFSEGKLIDMKDISEEVKKIEGQYHDTYHNHDIIERIDDSFKRDMELR